MADLYPNTPIQHEPKQKHRWVLRFPPKIGLQEWQIAGAARPKQNITEHDINFINQTQYVAGKYNWDAMNVKVIDYIGPSSMQAVVEWIRLCAEETTGRMGYAAGYMVDLELELLDPSGVTIEKWIIQDSWITSSDPGALDYADGGLLEIDLTIRYARAIHIF